MNSVGTWLSCIIVLGGASLLLLPEVSSRQHEDSPDDHSTHGDSSDKSRSEHADLVGKKQPGFWHSFAAMHEHFTEAFVEAEGFGVSRMPVFDTVEERLLFVNQKPLRVSQVRLIGLRSNPVAYDSEAFLLSRDELHSYVQRPLNAEELQAHDHLQSGRQFVWIYDADKHSEMSTTDAADGKLTSESALTHIDDASNVMTAHTVIGRLYAPLRTTAACVECHNVQPDTMLGILIYEMSPPKIFADESLFLDESLNPSSSAQL